MAIKQLPHFALLFLLCAPLTFGQHRHDPLSDAEINQLRDAAIDANTRLKLYVEFARTRVNAVTQVQSDKTIKDRGQQTRDKLQGFVDVYDELDENIDNFVKRDADLRKPLKLVIEADNEFQAKLRALHDAANASPEATSQYQFLLSDALDALDAGVKDHRDLLAEQEEAAKHKKKAPQRHAEQEYR